MRMFCRQTHALSGLREAARYGPMVHDSFEEFAVCQFMNGPWWLRRFLLFYVGCIDAETESGTAFWRWDIWNSNHARWYRLYRRGGLTAVRDFEWRKKR